MKNRALYFIITTVIVLINLLQLYWLLRIVLQDGFQYENNISLFVTHIHTYIALIGSAIFLSSTFRRSSLLRIYMCYCIINLPISSAIYYKALQNLPLMADYNLMRIANDGLSVVLFVACCVGLWKLTNDRVLKLTYSRWENGSLNVQFIPATKGIRFANKIVDAAMILFIAIINTYDNFLFEKTGWDEYISSGNDKLLVQICLDLFFYFLLEGIFRTTPGRCATNTLLVDEEGRAASFKQAVGRAFSRLIPFEEFSFLGISSRGWHDTITETYVAESIYAGDVPKEKQEPDANEPEYRLGFTK